MDKNEQWQRLLAAGWAGEVYEMDEERVLKLYPKNYEKFRDAEYGIAALAHAKGLPSPDVLGTVTVRGRPGVVFAKVHGWTAEQTLRRRPWSLCRVARQVAELHARVHACSIPALPRLVPRLWKLISRPGALPGLQTQVLTLLSGVREEGRVCHGDPHLGNVMFTRGGPVLVDWVEATCGHPLLDVAGMSLRLLIAPLPPRGVARWFWGRWRGRFVAEYLGRYFELRPDQRPHLARWQALAAAANLLNGLGPAAEYRRALRAALEGRATLPAELASVSGLHAGG